jgi:hypothetical protein
MNAASMGEWDLSDDVAIAAAAFPRRALRLRALLVS